jgi:hypothetical protein
MRRARGIDHTSRLQEQPRVLILGNHRTPLSRARSPYLIMSPQLELLHKYAKALSGRDFALLKEVLHPHTFAFTMTPKSMGIPVIEGAEAFVGAATGMLTPPKKVSMHIDEKEVLESGNRIWAAVRFSRRLEVQVD